MALKVGAGARVLVVDDDPDVAAVVAEALRDLGHVVETAEDGWSALQVAVGLRPQVVILDLDLPEMDGYELATRLKKMRLLPSDLRLIAFSGHDRSPERERSSHVVFDHYLMKPGSLDVLVHAVDHAGAPS